MSPQTSLSVLIALCSCLLVPCFADDDFIRFYTDSGSIVEIENRALESASQYPALSGSTSAVVASSNNQGLAQEHRIETRAAKQRFCGELLVNALALVCKGNYKKRTQTTPLSAEINYPVNYQSKERYNYEAYGSEGHQTNNEGYSNWPEFFEILKNANTMYRVAPSTTGHGTATSASSNSNELQKAAVNAAGRAKLRPKRGVVDECCKKPCSTNTLSQYCSL